MILSVLAGLGTFVAAILIGRLLQPHGTHRAPRPVPVSPYPDSEPCTTAWCAECARSEPHAQHTDGSRTCWTCRTTTPEGS